MPMRRKAASIRGRLRVKAGAMNGRAGMPRRWMARARANALERSWSSRSRQARFRAGPARNGAARVGLKWRRTQPMSASTGGIRAPRRRPYSTTHPVAQARPDLTHEPRIGAVDPTVDARAQPPACRVKRWPARRPRSAAGWPACVRVSRCSSTCGVRASRRSNCCHSGPSWMLTPAPTARRRARRPRSTTRTAPATRPRRQSRSRMGLSSPVCGASHMENGALGPVKVAVRQQDARLLDAGRRDPVAPQWR